MGSFSPYLELRTLRFKDNAWFAQGHEIIELWIQNESRWKACVLKVSSFPPSLSFSWRISLEVFEVLTPESSACEGKDDEPLGGEVQGVWVM